MSPPRTATPVKTVSGAIVFTDIAGFTEFTAARGDEAALALLPLQERLGRAGGGPPFAGGRPAQRRRPAGRLLRGGGAGGDEGDPLAHRALPRAAGVGGLLPPGAVAGQREHLLHRARRPRHHPPAVDR